MTATADPPVIPRFVTADQTQRISRGVTESGVDISDACPGHFLISRTTMEKGAWSGQTRGGGPGLD